MTLVFSCACRQDTGQRAQCRDGSCMSPHGSPFWIVLRPEEGVAGPGYLKVTGLWVCGPQRNGKPPTLREYSALTPVRPGHDVMVSFLPRVTASVCVSTDVPTQAVSDRAERTSRADFIIGTSTSTVRASVLAANLL